eukprot:TRINITY_DN6243_c0_g1_i2.p2 TRINITY_DN6243_c0_g1~~TRINITY_DN6243_c0_g1_i2.p2  ORF type:complete len:148 (-),score=100.31 TRINITY_DN6243_c0_g1_i2:87-530(-)
MAPKKDTKAKPSKQAKAAKTGGGGGKQKKKKWSKGKTKEKLNNLVLLDVATQDRLNKEIPTSKLVTISILSERLKISGSLARRAIKNLEARGLIRPVSKHHSQIIYTRVSSAAADAAAAAAAVEVKVAKPAKGAKGAKGAKVVEIKK